MKSPQQSQNIDADRQALAPYNFVELPERVAKLSADDLPDQDMFESTRHSGWLNCRLVTESPTFVRGGVSPQQAENGIKAKDLPDFFFVWSQDEPMIPGSTVRGVIRALVEIISYGKVSDVTTTKLIYRAIGDTTSHGERYRERVMAEQGGKKYTPKYHGGYLHRQGSDWYIRPAVKINGTSYAVLKQPIGDRFYFDQLKRWLMAIPGCQNAYKVYVKVGPYDFQKVRGGFIEVRNAIAYDPSPVPQAGWVEGTLALSGPMLSKRSEAVVFAADHDAQELGLSDEQVEDYRNQISKEQEKLLGKGGVLKEGQPVFYTLTETDAVEFFGHCRMLRLPYTKSPYDFVPEDLQREQTLDLPEALFGFTQQSVKEGKVKQEINAYAGRVSFSDARLVKGQQAIWLSPHRAITPRILASPKPTTFQHYLVQTQPNKIQVGRNRRGEQRYEVRLTDYTAPTLEHTVIRGHKLYWHQGAVQLQDIELHTQAQDTQLTEIKPLRAGVEFQFRIRFDNLSNVELGALLWVLQLASNERYRLKVGMGKPLGMGAVKIRSALQLVDRDARYTDLFSGDDWAEGLKPDKVASEIQQRALPAFERFVLAHLDHPGARRLEELERIQQLLAMLSWLGPDRKQTRYLEIEYPDPQARRGKRNEYRERPVLPNPLDIWQPGVEDISPQHSQVRDTAQTRTEQFRQSAQTDTSQATSFTNLRQIFNADRTVDSHRASPVASQRPRKKREWIVLMTPVRDGKARARLEGGEEEFTCTNISIYLKLKVGDRCQAEVTYNGEIPVSAIFKRQN